MTNHEISKPTEDNTPPRNKVGRRYTQAEREILKIQIFERIARRMKPYHIAQELNIHQHTVTQLAKEAYAEFQPIVQEELKKDIQLLNDLLIVATDRYLKTKNPRDYEPVAKMLDRRAKLLGLDAAQKVDVSVVEVTQEDIALMELINEAKAANADVEQEIKESANNEPA